jgi:phage terminase small subunit
VLQARWNELVTTLTASRVLTPDCGAVLACLTVAEADYRSFLARWITDGRQPVIAYEFQDGEGVVRRRMVANPLVRILRDQARLVVQLATDFGLSPASASKVQTQGSEPDPGFDAFLAGPTIVPFAKRKKA